MHVRSTYTSESKGEKTITLTINKSIQKNIEYKIYCDQKTNQKENQFSQENMKNVKIKTQYKKCFYIKPIKSYLLKNAILLFKESILIKISKKTCGNISLCKPNIKMFAVENKQENMLKYFL